MENLTKNEHEVQFEKKFAELCDAVNTFVCTDWAEELSYFNGRANLLRQKAKLVGKDSILTETLKHLQGCSPSFRTNACMHLNLLISNLENHVQDKLHQVN